MNPKLRHRRLMVRVLVISLMAMGALGLGPLQPAAAYPTFACTPESKDVEYIDPPNSRGDYIVWVCHVGSIFGYWWKIDRVGNINEDLESMRSGYLKFAREELNWQEVIQGALGLLSGPSGRQDSHFLGAIDLRNNAGEPVERRLGMTVTTQYSTNSGASWNNCGASRGFESTGLTSVYWQNLSPGSPPCGTALYQVRVSGKFLSFVTGQWTAICTFTSPSLQMAVSGV